MTLLSSLAILLILIGAFFLLQLFRQKQSFGILNEKRLYVDAKEQPGKVIYSKSIPLCGKPDYILQTKEGIIPVEVKTGKTPTRPYDNHIMQLMAYCYLVEGLYGQRPPGGYIRYPEKEFSIAYTDEAKESVMMLVEEIEKYKKSGEEFHCNHPFHYET